MTLMQRIFAANTEYFNTNMKLSFEEALASPEAIAATEKCRALEDELAKRFKEHLSQYGDGLITASELLSRMLLEAYKE